MPKTNPLCCIFSKEKLFAIRHQTPEKNLPILELLIGGTAAVCGRSKHKHRLENHVGALVRLRQQGCGMPLPAKHQTNIRSLPYKIDKLLLLNKSNRDFARSAALCFTLILAQ